MSILASQISFNEGIVRLAKIHKRMIEFRYEKSPGAPIETRRLKPETFREGTKGMSFVGFDPDRQAPRSFRVDRIRGDVTVVA